MAQLFQESLTGSALRWFLSMDEAHVKTWEDVCNQFTDHYKYNNEVDVTRRDLETTKQGIHESFSSYITRWRQKASRMTTRPTEEEQIQMVVKNLLPAYHKHLFAHYFPSFKALIGAGTQVEDALYNGSLKTEEYNKNRRPVSTTYNKPTAEINNIPQPIHTFALKADPPRQFAELYMPPEKVFEKLKARNLITPLEPKPLPNPLPRGFNENEYCKYHQIKGHSTNRCIRLRHIIQD
ncbi:hypothetical protein HGI15_22190, partial [Modestobacter lapidis]|nr:hypothetical protein [Modestobacter lapidis]